MPVDNKPLLGCAFPKLLHQITDRVRTVFANVVLYALANVPTTEVIPVMVVVAEADDVRPYIVSTLGAKENMV